MVENDFNGYSTSTFSNCSSNSVLLHLLSGLACNIFIRMYTAHVPQIHWIYCVSFLASLAQDDTQYCLSPCH